MARIRTIKPEFPQSESMGRISRDARLLFIQLWTLCDDEGRTRGNSRMLASLLFPYDDDAPSLVDGWISELEDEGCIVRYMAEGQTYIQVINWLNHQKIDHASKSKIPAFHEDSLILAKPREHSCLDQGSRTKDQGPKEKPTADKPPRFDAMTMLLPKDLEVEVWQTWVNYRKALKGKQPVQLTWEAQANNLATWQKDGHDPRAIIKNSIDNGYQGLFEPKRNGGKSNADSRADVIAAFTGRRRESTLQGAIEGDYRTVESG